MTASRRRLLLVVVLLAVASALVPLLRADEIRRQSAWESRCLASGGSVWTAPPSRDNPLVVQLPRPTYECRDAVGVLVAVRD